MLTEIYIEALLVDEELADQVWEAWDKGEIDDQVAWLAWRLMAFRPLDPTTELIHCGGWKRNVDKLRHDILLQESLGRTVARKRSSEGEKD